MYRLQIQLMEMNFQIFMELCIKGASNNSYEFSNPNNVRICADSPTNPLTRTFTTKEYARFGTSILKIYYRPRGKGDNTFGSACPSVCQHSHG